MLTFKDRKVIDALCKVLITSSRIGDHINIVSNERFVQFFTVNSSLSVVGEIYIPSRLFQGTIVKSAHVKARSVELISRIILRTPVNSMYWKFVVSNSGEEILEVMVVYPNKIEKKFTVPLIHVVSSQLDFHGPKSKAFSFSCLTSTLRDSFSHCDMGADEIKFEFNNNRVNIYTRKIYRGLSGGSFNGIPLTFGSVSCTSKESVIKGAPTKCLRSSSTGLSTTVTIQPDTFDQITMQIPLQLSFKFKEFRAVVNAMHALGEKVVLQAKFDAELNNNDTVLEFRVASPISPPFGYVFRFLAKQISDENVGELWLKVGQQQQQQNDSLNLYEDNEMTEDTSQSHPRTLLASNRVIELESTHSEQSFSVSTSDIVEEVGYTQGGPSGARGLFD